MTNFSRELGRDCPLHSIIFFLSLYDLISVTFLQVTNKLFAKNEQLLYYRGTNIHLVYLQYVPKFGGLTR